MLNINLSGSKSTTPGFVAKKDDNFNSDNGGSDKNNNNNTDSVSDYMEKKHIGEFMEHLLHEMLLTQPEDPISYLKEMMDIKNCENDEDVVRKGRPDVTDPGEDVRRQKKRAGSSELNNCYVIPQKIIVIGPPLSGKTSQARLISKKTGALYINIGELIEEVLSSNSIEMAKIAAIIHPIMLQNKFNKDKGNDIGDKDDKRKEKVAEMIPDNVLVDLIFRKITKNHAIVKKYGWVIDNFPRTKAQAIALQHFGIIPTMFLTLETLSQGLSPGLNFKNEVKEGVHFSEGEGREGTIDYIDDNSPNRIEGGSERKDQGKERKAEGHVDVNLLVKKRVADQIEEFKKNPNEGQRHTWENDKHINGTITAVLTVGKKYLKEENKSLNNELDKSNKDDCIFEDIEARWHAFDNNRKELEDCYNKGELIRINSLIGTNNDEDNEKNKDKVFKEIEEIIDAKTIIIE